MDKTIVVTEIPWGYQGLVSSFNLDKTYVVKAKKRTAEPREILDYDFECTCNAYKYRKNKSYSCKHIIKLIDYLVKEKGVYDIPF